MDNPVKTPRKILEELLDFGNRYKRDETIDSALAQLEEYYKLQINGDTSDGYHTFNELYEHRYALFIALMKSHPKISWRANNHDDGTMFDGWFIAGIHFPVGDISYHLPLNKWGLLDNAGITTTNKAPAWDNHASQDVIQRLNSVQLEEYYRVPNVEELIKCADDTLGYFGIGTKMTSEEINKVFEAVHSLIIQRRKG
jgi:hypothetical protein